jgi:transposase
MLRMEAVGTIRHLVLAEGWTIRRVARELRVSRNTIRRYLAGAEPGVRKDAVRTRPVLERVRARLDALLAEAPQWTQGKQRLTATRLHRLVVEEGHAVGATLVKAYVAEWKRRRQEVFIPLVYEPGDLGEVDFFEVWVDVAGVRQKAWLFVLRLMASGRDFAWLYPRQDQVCFLDGHVRAFAHLGGVPHRLLYDNLRAAVARVLVGAARVLTTRMQALVAHYAFEPCFARPGTGHDKGGVESRGRAIRWQDLVPIPAGPDLETISARLLARLDARLATQRDAEGRTLGERFALEQARLLPLPARPFAAAAVHIVPVSRRALVRLEGALYSVPAGWADLDITAHVGPTTVTLVGRDGHHVLHRRGRFGTKTIDYRHYLRELSRKPQAVRQVAGPLVRDLGAPFDRVWQRLVDVHGPAEAARHFARVLGAIVTLGHATVVARLETALATDTPLGLALAPPAPAPPSLPLAALPPSVQDVTVLAARAADYDALLEAMS